MDYPKKVYAILAIVLIVAVPFIIFKIQNKPEEIENVPEENIESALIPLENDKNVVRVSNLDQTDLGQEIKQIINLNGKIFAIGKNGIIEKENQSAFSYPDNFSMKLAAGMDDLNLIFVLSSNNKLLSWSPTAKQFSENQLNIPEGSDISAIETYLTYLYLVDKNNNQIYRYPRASGGFGEKTDWLKETADLGAAESLAISENIYLASGQNLLSFSKGKKQDFQIESTETPIEANKVYIKRDEQNIYVLDKNNSRIVKLDLAGSIVSQFYHPDISQASGFSALEEKNIIYFSKENKIESFIIN